VTPPSADAALTVFVYFRTAPGHHDRTQAALGAQLAAARGATGVEARAGVRHDADKPYLTWLEVYEPVPAARLRAVLESIDACAEATGLAALALEGRHAEVFESLPGLLAGGEPRSGSGSGSGPEGRPPCA
jgi:hypothetical protein